MAAYPSQYLQKVWGEETCIDWVLSQSPRSACPDITPVGLGPDR